MTVVTALVFAKAGAEMVLARDPMAQTAARLGITLPQFRAIGALELAGAGGLVTGLWWTPLGTTAAGCLALLTLGAAATHLRAGDPPKDLAPAVVCCLLSLATLALLLTS